MERSGEKTDNISDVVMAHFIYHLGTKYHFVCHSPDNRSLTHHVCNMLIDVLFNELPCREIISLFVTNVEHFLASHPPSLQNTVCGRHESTPLTSVWTLEHVREAILTLSMVDLTFHDPTQTGSHAHSCRCKAEVAKHACPSVNDRLIILQRKQENIASTSCTG